MIFSSLPFIVFWAAYLFIVSKLKKYQLLFLTVASVLFYSYSNIYHTFILISICAVAYVYSLYKFNFALLCILLLSPLAYFKYFRFFADIFGVSGVVDISPYVANGIPIGLSFVTFSLLALAVAIKKSEWEGITFTQIVGYIFYFPQLIAGPIVRPHQLLPQITKDFHTSSDAIKKGTVIFSIGLIKKIYIADTLAALVDPVFAAPEKYSSGELLTAALLFGQQIYFDFSGYSSMAIGIAITLGVKLPENFDRPYLTTSITHFWQHWHMTLSAWVRDFIYIPLGGNRSGNFRTAFNIIASMLISGLWHGAGVGFILWGGLHGLIMAVERFFHNHDYKIYIPNILKIIITCFLVSNLWILFRIENLSDISRFFSIYNIEALTSKNAIFAFVAVIVLTYLQRFDRHDLITEKIGKVRWTFVFPIIVVVIAAGLIMTGGTSQKFIYFDF